MDLQQNFDDIPDEFPDDVQDEKKATPKILKRVRKKVSSNNDSNKAAKIEVSGGAMSSAAEAKIKARQEKWGHDLYEQNQQESQNGQQQNIFGPIPGFKNNNYNQYNNNNTFNNNSFNSFQGQTSSFHQRGGTRGGHRFGYGNQAHHGGTIIRREVEDESNKITSDAEDDGDDGMRLLEKNVIY